jgi:hypothetical protein
MNYRRRFIEGVQNIRVTAGLSCWAAVKIDRTQTTKDDWNWIREGHVANHVFKYGFGNNVIQAVGGPGQNTRGDSHRNAVYFNVLDGDLPIDGYRILQNIVKDNRSAYKA